MAGQVRVNGQIVINSSILLESEADICIEHGQRFVSRGGEKLDAAITAFKVDVSGLICADVGASTGGFTDCLLQHGAQRVYAIDVGHGILEWKLRQDERVIVMEKTNARFVKNLPEAVAFVTIDVSFISLRLILPVIKGWFPTTGCSVITLIKPQFEVDRQAAARCKGVVRDPNLHRQTITNVLAFAQEIEFGVMGLIRSPLLGPKGNVEFLAHLIYPHMDKNDLEEIIENVVIPTPQIVDESISHSTT